MMQFQYDDYCIYAEDENGQLLAEITYPPLDAETVHINHTYVHPSLRGRGIADALMRAAMDDIRARNLKAMATCSYARKWLAAHDEAQDILCSRS